MKIEVKRSSEYYRQLFELLDDKKKEIEKLRKIYERRINNYKTTFSSFEFKRAMDIGQRIIIETLELRKICRHEISIIDQWKKSQGL